MEAYAVSFVRTNDMAAASPQPQPNSLDASAELAFAGLRGQAELLAEGRTSSRELVELSLERIAATRETLGAFRCVRADAARSEAGHEGDDRPGVLFGVGDRE